ncbi:MAG: sulfatase-like hydrolase/transferase [Verrucomicrobiae bacterium]|nr:sulfatase-like hydrolase/transferase [Verrucomicrobiae bacterium]
MGRHQLAPILLLGIATAASVGGPACAAGPGAGRPNILLLVSDDQRPDTIRALGNPVIATPTFDRLVGDGTAFTRAVCSYPLCYPSRAEILTGTTVFRNGVYDRGRLDATAATLPALLLRAGYRTCHVGKWHVAGKPRDRGYETVEGMYAQCGPAGPPRFDERAREITGYRGWTFCDADCKALPGHASGLTRDISAAFADAAIRFIGAAKSAGRPFFLHVNFTAPHDPLMLPGGFEGRYEPGGMPMPRNFLPEHAFDHGNLRGRDEALWPWPRTESDVREELALYYAVITHLDAQVGRIFEALDASGELGRTVVIYTSDNGLAIGSHGLRGKQNMYEHSIGVPLLLRGPGIRAGVRSATPCHLRDLFPTICELAKVPVPPGLAATSLAPLLQGEGGPVRDFVVGYFRDSQRMIRTERWKLIRYPLAGREQLFDLRSDPDEMADLSADPGLAGILDGLRGDLAAWLTENGDPLTSRR